MTSLIHFSLFPVYFEDLKLRAMKRMLPLLLSILLYHTSTVAQEVVHGYMLSEANDTVACTISLPEGRRGAVDEASLSEEVVIIDSSEKRHRYSPKNLPGYGFKYEGRMLHYRSRSIGGNTFFLRLVVEGARMTCYQYYKRYHTSALPNSPFKPNPALGPNGQKYYVLEDREQHRLAVDPINYIDRSRKLKAFFAGKPDQLALYEETVRDFADVPYFAAVLNAR